MLAFDHVVFVVRDLAAAARSIYEMHGLASVAGGTHPGHGTGNIVVPLGPSYVELLAVVDPDEAAGSPLGRWVAERVDRGEGPAALCLRTEDIAVPANRLGLEPVAMTRRKPDGSELAWRLAGLDRMLEDGYPFFIEWQSDDEVLPGRARIEHEVLPRGIAWVEIGGSEAETRAWLGPNHLDIRVIEGVKGVRRVGIETAGGEIVL